KQWSSIALAMGSGVGVLDLLAAQLAYESYMKDGEPEPQQAPQYLVDLLAPLAACMMAIELE
ncbi:hypothetical protein, partial [Citrobacter youngae]|uniref:hypothetical protein n=1 Tax=Citrobacter youngae TaxID=133448 RepID=UPI001952B407